MRPFVKGGVQTQTFSSFYSLCNHFVLHNSFCSVSSHFLYPQNSQLNIILDDNYMTLESFFNRPKFSFSRLINSYGFISFSEIPIILFWKLKFWVKWTIEGNWFSLIDSKTLKSIYLEFQGAFHSFNSSFLHREGVFCLPIAFLTG